VMDNLAEYDQSESCVQQFRCGKLIMCPYLC